MTTDYEALVASAGRHAPSWMLTPAELTAEATSTTFERPLLPEGVDVDSLEDEWRATTRDIASGFASRRPDSSVDRLYADDAREQSEAIDSAAAKIRARLGV